MCLITLLPPGIRATGETLRGIRNGLEVNPDGAGFAIVADGYVIRERDMDGDALASLFTAARSLWRDHWACFWSRTATTGGIGPEYLHPLQVGADPATLLFHNGTIAEMDSGEDTRSDSQRLADMLGDPDGPRLGLDFLGADLALLETLIGSYNKAAVLSANPAREECVIVNRGQWLVTPQGVLHSNADYLGQGDGWRECRDDDGKLYRWSALQPGQCPDCHLYGCKWLDWDEDTRRPCKPAPTRLPRFRCETDRIAGLR